MDLIAFVIQKLDFGNFFRRERAFVRQFLSFRIIVELSVTVIRANDRPPMLEKWNYIPWESRFRRLLDNKLEDGERMWQSIKKGPYERPLIIDPDDDKEKILEPLSKMIESNKKQYIADVKVEMWEQTKRLMFGSDITNYVRHSRLMDEFDKFTEKEGESLESVYERLTTLVNIMDHNNVRPIPVSINTKFLNCLQPEWSKYVTMVRHNQTGDTVSYDQLYDSLVQFKTHVQASKAKRAARNHERLALIAHSNASSSQSHANPSYSHSRQPYYVTHPSPVVDYGEDYQGELQGDSQEDKLTTAMMLLAQAITQKFSTPTNNRLRTSSNTRNQAVIQDGRVDIQTKNTGYGGNGNRIAGRQNRNQAFNAGNGNDESNQIVQRVPRTESNSGKANVQCYNYNEKGYYARDGPKPRVRDAKYFREQMLLAMKDEAGSKLNDEENDFMLNNSFGDETLEELTAKVIMMARIQPADDNGVQKPNYDAKVVSEVNASHKMIPKRIHEHKNHGKHKTIINTSDDDQIDSNIIFDDPYVENNGGSDEHDSTAHDQYHDVKIPAYNALREAEIKKQLNNELKKQKNLVKKAFKEREDRYLEDIVDLEEKLSSHDRMVYKMGQSIQMIHMLGKTQSQVYDPFLKAGLGYKNPERLKKAIAAQPKMYHGEKLYSTKLKIDSHDSEETLEDAEESIESSNSVRRPQSKDTKLKNRVLKNTNAKSSSAYVRKVSSSVRIDSNKGETENSNECQSNASVLNTKNVNAVNDGSNLVCVSCGKNVFLLSYETCVARYALSVDSRVKRALFTSPVAAKSRNLGATYVVIQLILWIIDSGCSKHMTGNLQLLRNFVEKLMGTVRFENDHFAAITGYGDYGVDLLTGSRESNLYTISISELAASSPVCLMSKVPSTKYWLWHRKLSHLNFGTINQLTSKDLVDGLLKFKYDKDYLCSACEQGKSKKASFPSKLVPST
ncbi:putative ribonuclease H-like domain-containing protein [Tanacetum coccineum]